MDSKDKIESKRKENVNNDKIEVNDSKYGVFGAMSMIISCIIGSGIFSVVKGTFELTPLSFGPPILIWLVCGLISIGGGLIYVNLGTTITSSSAESAYLSTAFGNRFGVFFTFITISIIKPLTISGLSLISSQYILLLSVENPQEYTQYAFLCAFLIIAGLCIVNTITNKLAIKGGYFFMLMKILAILTISVTGFVYIIKGKTQNFKEPFNIKVINMNKISTAFASALWGFEGWNMANYIIKDIKNPQKNLPLGVIGGTLSVVVLYLFCIISYAAVLPINVLSTENAIGWSFAKESLGKFKSIIPVFIVISTIGSINSNMYAISNLAYCAAIDKRLPSCFLLKSKFNHSIASFSIIYTSLMSVIYIPFGFDGVVSLFGVISWSFYFLTTMSLIYIRTKLKHLKQPFQAPWIVILTVSFASIFVFISSIIENFIGVSIVVIICLTIFLFICLLEAYPFKSIRTFSDKLTIFLLKSPIFIEQEQV